MTFDTIRSFYHKWRSKRPNDLHPAKNNEELPPSFPIKPDPPVSSFPNEGIAPRGETEKDLLQNTGESSSHAPPALHKALAMHGNDPLTTSTGESGPSRPEIITEIQYHPDIVASMQELARKYVLAEITVATDDGLVIATSASRDVEFDAVHYSQVVQLMTSPSEPDVSLFELHHKGSHLIGIIRSSRHIHPILKEQIRDDTKVILQWWL